MERAKGENQPRYIDIGGVDSGSVISVLDDEFNTMRSDCWEDYSEYLNDQAIYEIMRENYLALFEDRQINGDVRLAALIITANESATEYQVDLMDISELNEEGNEFYIGAAIAYIHLAEDMIERGFDIGAHEAGIRPLIETRLPQDKVVQVFQAEELAEDIFERGQQYFAVYEPYWRDVFERHGELFKPNASFDASWVKAGIGHVIYLVRSSLCRLADRHNEEVMESEVQRFRNLLESVKTFDDLEHYFRTD